MVACDVRRPPHAAARATPCATAARTQRPRSCTSAATDALPFAPVFDRVLVDAPCSGLGTVRRDPDIRWRRREAELADFAATQRALLARAARAVAPGGRLVYATCSSEPEENEDVVEGFLAAHPEFTRLVPRRTRRSPPGSSTTRGMLRTLPFAHGLEAFFAAASSVAGAA